MSERDKYLTEAMGMCWHNFRHGCGCCDGICEKCGTEGRRESDMPVYSEWEGFGKLIKSKIIPKGYIKGAVGAALYKALEEDCTDKIPDIVADAVYQYLRDSREVE